jgi:aminocarboxymuconate-semialdehyde decarboxylase
MVVDWNLDARELDVIWEVCEELDCPVFVHPWDMQDTGRMKKYWFPWLIGKNDHMLTMQVCRVKLQ